jgi:hypothetical protein
MRLLLACFDGLAWPPKEPPPLIASCLEHGAAGPLRGIPSLKQLWLIDNEPIWSHFEKGGLNVGLMNLPGLEAPQAVNGFMVCRGQRQDQGRGWTHPPELAHDLGDYIQPQRLPASAAQWRDPLKDTAFAQAAALARLRFEHFRRLCAAHQVEVAAIGWSALATARHLFNEEAGRAALMLAQLDAYLARLMEEFAPRALVATGMGFGSEPGMALILAPDQMKPGRWEQDSWRGLLELLPILAGLPSPARRHLLSDLLVQGGA